jgi:hypothetical protein
MRRATTPGFWGGLAGKRMHMAGFWEEEQNRTELAAAVQPSTTVC